MEYKNLKEETPETHQHGPPLFHTPPPGNQPPGNQPPGNQPPSNLPPGNQPPVNANNLTQANPQVIVVVAPTGSSLLHPRKSRWLLGMGATQLTLGLLMFIINMPATGLFINYIGYVGAGYWCGLLAILAGSFGIAAGKKRSRGFAITFMVLSIITSVFTIFGLFTTTIIGLTAGQYDYYYDDNESASYALNSILLTLSVAEFVISIISSALCCWAFCCKGNPRASQSMPEARYTVNLNGQTYQASPWNQNALPGGFQTTVPLHQGQQPVNVPSQTCPAYHGGSPPPVYVLQADGKQ